jgi:hypothetical protein
VPSVGELSNQQSAQITFKGFCGAVSAIIDTAHINRLNVKAVLSVFAYFLSKSGINRNRSCANLRKYRVDGVCTVKLKQINGLLSADIFSAVGKVVHGNADTLAISDSNAVRLNASCYRDYAKEFYYIGFPHIGSASGDCITSDFRNSCIVFVALMEQESNLHLSNSGVVLAFVGVIHFF